MCRYLPQYYESNEEIISYKNVMQFIGNHGFVSENIRQYIQELKSAKHDAQISVKMETNKYKFLLEPLPLTWSLREGFKFLPGSTVC